MSVTITTDQKVGLHVDAVTALGNPAQLDAPPTWVSSDPGIAQVVDVDGYNVQVLSVAVGACDITVSATSFGLPVPPTSTRIDVLPAPAAQLIVTAGVPENK